jgi:magnesium-protoporphyrin IX monomethyl ester (oxidative) cyclase
MPDRRIERVLLISLPAIMEQGAAENEFNSSHAFHLGLAYIAGLLRANHIDVGILDCLVEDPHNIRSIENEWCEVGLSDERILEFIGEFHPEMIGISIAFSYQHQMAMKLAQKLKLAFPGLLIVAGGNHVSAMPGKIDRSSIDYLILGEGELAMLQLINALNGHQSTDGIPGVISQDSSTFPRAPFIKDLDQLPFPAIDLLPLEKLWGGGRRWINMVATRGCPFDCVFCSIHTITGHTIRRRSVEDVVTEIRHWHKLYKIQEIYFEDDNLTTHRQWAKELFRQIAASNFGIRLYARNGIRADSIDKELLTLMKAAGYKDFYIAPESGSQETLDMIIGKKMDLDDCTQAVKLAREIGLQSNAFFVIGFPQERLEDIQTTISYARYLKALGCDGFWFSLAVPYPGTRLYKQCLEHGSITDDFDYRKLRVAKSVIMNENFSRDQVESMRQSAMDELSHTDESFSGKVLKAAALLVHDPAFFFSKFQSKLGLLNSKSLNQRIIRNASSLLSK